MNSAALLDAWEEGQSCGRIVRPLVLLAACQPGATLRDLADLPIGERDARLLRLRESLFGSRMDAVASCPNCGESLDIPLTTDQIRVKAPPALAQLPMSLSREGFEVSFRLPTTSDLVAVSTSSGDPRLELLTRCVSTSIREGADSTVGELPPTVLEAVVDQMGKCDPQAVVELALDCPACHHGWTILFDISGYLWGEIEELSRKLLREIHLLASAYGWSERDILAMSSRRRRIYLEMVEG